MYRALGWLEREGLIEKHAQEAVAGRARVRYGTLAAGRLHVWNWLNAPFLVKKSRHDRVLAKIVVASRSSPELLAAYLIELEEQFETRLVRSNAAVHACGWEASAGFSQRIAALRQAYRARADLDWMRMVRGVWGVIFRP
ncbi:MAG: hypothetical protein ABGY42_04475 [bacterium]